VPLDRHTSAVSYELVFWNQEPGMCLEPRAVYGALMDGSEVEGLSELPIGQLLQRLSDVFLGAIREMNGATEWLVWVRPEPSAVLEVTWSGQHLRADCRGLGNDEMNRVISVANGFGCPLYDPQIDERFVLPG
jgi:hypothetical protein